MISTTKVLDILKSNGFMTSWFWKYYNHDAYRESVPTLVVPNIKFGISDETYGKKTYLYFRFEDLDWANRAYDLLKKAGGKPDRSWYPDDPRYFEMRVSYFKGTHWYE